MSQARQQPLHAPKLDPQREERAERIRPESVHIIHESIRTQGEEELQRRTSALAWSGFAAGLSMGFSLIGQATLRGLLPPDSPWTPVIAKFGYSLGYLIVIMGRQQLFTESTLTAVLPVLAHRDLVTLGKMLRYWGLVLSTNLLGAAIIAAFLSYTPLLKPQFGAEVADIARATVAPGFWAVLLRGLVAGWLIATLVWMLPAVRSSQIGMIVLLTWLVGAGEFSHIVTGSLDVVYLLFAGEASWRSVLAFFGPRCSATPSAVSRLWPR